MQINLLKRNPKMVVYALIALAVWFSILTIIPMSFSQEKQETTSQKNEETQQEPEKVSLLSLAFAWGNAKKGLCIMYVLILGGIVLIFTIPERAAFFWVISRPKKGNSEVQNEDYYKKRQISIKKEIPIQIFPHLDIETFWERIDEKASAGDLDGAMEMCEKERHPVASVFSAGIEATQQYPNNPGNVNKKDMKAEIEKEMEIEGEIQMGRLEQRLWIIDSVATLAPMLGFLGTIVGLIGAFMGWGTAAAAGQQVGIGALAGGMYQAMLTTAGGLLIGIPATFANILINNRIRELSLTMSDYGNEILKKLIP